MLPALLSLSLSLTAKQTKIHDCLVAQLGKPYVYGATGPDSFDCSGLAQYCHRQAGITIPRTSLDQSKKGTLVTCSKAVVGDLIFFFDPVSHVATFTSATDVIHATNAKTPVSTTTNIRENSYWGPKINTCRRYWDANVAAANSTDAAESGESGSGPKTAVVVGASVGGVVLIAAAIVLALVLRGRRKKAERREASTATLIA
jgi:cell wall-associated NlpC family hydrolase